LKGFPDLPPIWLALFLSLTWLLATYLPLVTVFGPVLRAVGWLLMLAAFALVGWAAYWFWAKRTTIEPHHDPGRLIVEGPYRLSRNPIYLALLAILVGYVLSKGALSPVPLPVLFHWVLSRRFVLPEEAALRRAFGSEAVRYLQDTRRWL